MRKIILFALLIWSVSLSFGQRLKVQKSGSVLYITHKVTAKETLYSLGRTYHVTAKEIAVANKLKQDAGISVGQQIKIPLKKSNFIQQASKSHSDAEPVYYTVKKGDNLAKISKNYNRVKEADLKKWNHLSKSLIKPGQQLIIGYLKVSDDATTETANTTTDTNKKPTAPPKNTADAGFGEYNNNTATKPATVSNTNTKPAPANQSGDNVLLQVDSAASNIIPEESFFAANYSINAANAQERSVVGSAATFKSTSGWTDKKYYILMNDVAPETIVKITANGKSVYAKVLESLPDLKDNKNMLCRISNAAASVLGIVDPKFEVVITYYE